MPRWQLSTPKDAFTPYIADRGYEVEFHVETAPFETWKVDGTTPPPQETFAEWCWFKENRSSPYGELEQRNDAQAATA